MMRFIIIVLGLLCSHIGYAHESKDGKHQPHYKPGANISFNHDYDGSTELSGSELVNLQFTAHSLMHGEKLKVRFNPSSTIIIAGILNHELKTRNNTAKLSLEFSVNSPGRHYLGIQVELVDQSGKRNYRVFELPIQVGKAGPHSFALYKSRVSSTGRGLTILESRETVSRK